MELALLVAPRGTTLEAMHIWSGEKELADVLSRMTVDSIALPAVSSKVPRTLLRDCCFHVLGH